MDKKVYKVEIERDAVKELGDIPKKIRERLLAAIFALATDPTPPGVKRLNKEHERYPGAYRIRVAKYRVIYEIDHGILRVLIIRVAIRKEVYD